MARRSIDVPLYSPDGEPCWIEHPKRNLVDCAAVRIAEAESLDIATINEIDFEPALTPEVGADCFIIGYPDGLGGPKGTPIWKRASVATEPLPAFNGLPPNFLVDSASRKGMSGSPVIMRHNGFFANGPTLSDSSIFGTIENFVGIYSGRLGDDALGFQLGRVWERNLIEEMLVADLKGINPLDLMKT